MDWTYYEENEITPRFEVWDSTKVEPHADGKSFIAFSKQYVKLHDALTGEVLQTLVEPAIKRVDPKKGPRRSNAPLVNAAGWTDDEGIAIFSYDEYAVSLWRRK